MSTTNTKHTPGPWHATGIEQDHDSDRAIVAYTKSGNPVWIARAYGGGVLAPSDPERVANAELIAQAPTMAARIAELESQLARVTAQRDQCREVLAASVPFLTTSDPKAMAVCRNARAALRACYENGGAK